ncbi:hypothetical protein Q1695_011771 [Nippostrongylus brasiliensis]|nr:hypothetical protein Q1695_011771 [Nippostrongylus brasiliensis]
MRATDFQRIVNVGDSGGPLVQTRDGERDIQFGVASNDNTCIHNYQKQISMSDWHPCNNQSVHSKFGDVRKHLDWICSTAGTSFELLINLLKCQV